MKGMSWDRCQAIEDSVKSIFENRTPNHSFQKLVQIQLTPENRKLLQYRLSEILRDEVRGLQHYFLSLHGESFKSLENFVSAWENFIRHVELCSSLFPSLTSGFSEASTFLFLHFVLAKDRMKKNLQEWLSEVLCINTILIIPLLSRYFSLLITYGNQNALDTLVGLAFRNSVDKLYLSDATEFTQTRKVCEYVKWLQEVVIKTKDLWNSFESNNLNTIAWQYFLHGVTSILIDPFSDYLFYSDSGFYMMTQNWEVENLSFFVSTFSLTCEVSKLRSLGDKFVKQRLNTCLETLISDKYEGIEMMLDLLKYSSKLFELICGESTMEIHSIGKLQSIEFTEGVSIYYDRSVKTMEVNESTIKNLQLLFNLVEDEDTLFRALKDSMYVRIAEAEKSHLAVEKAFLLAIPPERRRPFLQIIEEVENSWAISAKFKKCLLLHGDHFPFDLRATVLRGSGGLPQTGSTVLPCAVKICQDMFSYFYSLLHSGRKVAFLPHWGTATFDFHHHGSLYHITVPTTFAKIILALNENKVFTADSLSAELSISKNVAKRQLRILLQNELVCEQGKANEYAFNEAFNASNSKIVIRDVVDSKYGIGALNCSGKSNKKCLASYVKAMIMKELKLCSPIPHKTLVNKLLLMNDSGHCVTSASVKEAIQYLLERESVIRTNDGYCFQL